ncbi:MAG TPA: hypothetical protein VKN99_13350 [Polyangia bacterium]|nr:hypothetical protein [Polyangia bacterium]
MLKPEEREAAEKWKQKHAEKCKHPDFIVVSNVSGYGYRLKCLCQTCGAKEDITGSARDWVPKH